MQTCEECLHWEAASDVCTTRDMRIRSIIGICRYYDAIVCEHEAAECINYVIAVEDLPGNNPYEDERS